MLRTEERELAFKTIYSNFFVNDADLCDNDELVDCEFANKILNSFNEHKEEINEKIAKHLKGYTIERLFKVDLAILILAVVELFYVKENPKEVVINEAVELAKKYSTEKSPKFINGVLADIVKE